MTRQNKIEEFGIILLDRLGYEYIYVPTIAPDAERPERKKNLFTAK